MQRHLTLILGGARSGKSTYAERLAKERGQSVMYVATAQAWDEEMAARIANHQRQRPDHWHTVEAATQVATAIEAEQRQTGPVDVVLVDCLTVLASNVLLALVEPVTDEAAQGAVLREVEELLLAYAKSSAQWILVSNEVGLGIVPAYALGRLYRDALGRANQHLASHADEVYFMVAGLPMVVKS